MKKRKKILLLLSTYFIILLTPKASSDNYENQVVYNCDYTYGDTNPYGYYNYKNIYVITPTNVDQIDLNQEGIYIIDNRYIKNANIAICDSYRICDKKEMRVIIKMLLEYERNHPSNWDRTEESMMNEWDIHNICYYFNMNRDSTHQVDFDNDDENKYNSKVLSKILGN